MSVISFAEFSRLADAGRHTPYLLLFDVDPANTILSTSYYQEQMFNLHHGTQTLPVTTTNGDFDPLFWQASIERDKVYLKIVNAGGSFSTLDVRLDTAYRAVNGTTMHASDALEDTTTPLGNDIVPQPIAELETMVTQQERRNGSLRWRVPPWSVNVLQFDLQQDYDSPRSSEL